MNTVVHLNKKTSQDINDISIPILQHVIAYIHKPLTHIFNLSIDLGIFPENMKVSKVLPLYKKSGSQFDLNNYRGISIINAFSKILEKLMSDRLFIFLFRSNFFYDKQFGFLLGRSTNQAILDVINFVSNIINDGKMALCLCLDIRKAFDAIPHSILFKKLENAGIRGNYLDWFKSYLSNRSQKVKLNNIFSTLFPLGEVGVLQGSILGVLLFLIFINDIGYVSQNLYSVLFADDINSLIMGNNIQEIIEFSNLEIKKLVSWYNSNKLSINSSKSKCMLFKHKFLNYLNLEIVDDFPVLPIYIDMNNQGENDPQKISRITMVPNKKEDTIRVLGVYLDQNLSMSPHMNIVRTRAAKGLHSLNSMKHILDKDRLKMIYFAHVHSHLSYCINTFCLMNQTTIKPLILLQKKAIRLICGAEFRAHTLPLFIKEQILPLEKLIDYHIALFMFDYVNCTLPETFFGTWELNWQRSGNFNSRRALDFFQVHIRYQYLFSHPLFKFPKIWNGLDNTHKNQESRYVFANDVKQFLFSKAIQENS